MPNPTAVIADVMRKLDDPATSVPWDINTKPDGLIMDDVRFMENLGKLPYETGIAVIARLVKIAAGVLHRDTRDALNEGAVDPVTGERP